ncbi:MAG: hypothetical protein RMJ51_06880 [Candidatus Calescibacterium sp.]|nr:hypothetical protein [Candidatus Calescibacterium sp.]MCX7972340.1 hypothetical protein [bacterium]MDW8195939.1 hypothetical protein [Candidatus Calescibacterium sp.]
MWIVKIDKEIVETTDSPEAVQRYGGLIEEYSKCLIYNQISEYYNTSGEKFRE